MTVSHAWPHVRYRVTSGERNFTERIKASIFLEVVLAIEVIYGPQSNLEQKVNPSILKDDILVKIFHPEQLKVVYY